MQSNAAQERADKSLSLNYRSTLRDCLQYCLHVYSKLIEYIAGCTQSCLLPPDLHAFYCSLYSFKEYQQKIAICEESHTPYSLHSLCALESSGHPFLIKFADMHLITHDDIGDTVGCSEEGSSGEMKRPWCPEVRLAEHRQQEQLNREAEERRRASQSQLLTGPAKKFVHHHDFPALPEVRDSCLHTAEGTQQP